ncbi:MAG: NAD(P)-dependent oxidoreductase [Pseudomonadota bacterium]
MTRIAFLGLGAMGRRMASRLVDAEYDITLWNRTELPEDILPGTRRSATVKEAVSKADLIFSMVTDDLASRAVWTGEDGAIAGMEPGAVAIECSTLSPAWVAELAKAVAEAGCAFADIPVAGSLPQAEAGQLIFLAGGTDAVVSQLTPIANAMGQSVLHAGGVGQGTVLKLIVNAQLAIQTATMTELMRFADARGMGRALALDLLSQTPVLSPTSKAVGAQILAGADDPMFTIDLLVKDLGYMLDTGPWPITDAARTVYSAAQGRSLGSRHITAIAR